MNQLRLPKVVGMGQVLWVFFKSVFENLHLLPLHHQLGFPGFRALRRCQWRRKSIWTRCSSARTTVTSGTLISWAPFRSTLHIVALRFGGLAKATYNFTTLIGQRTFGPVYKAQILTSETIAVKVLATDSKQGAKEFQTELAEASKAQFSRDYSDHFALVRAYEGWKEAERGVVGYAYCWKNFLSAQSMKAIDTLQREFYPSLKEYVLNFNARWL